jgi:N-acetylneuraminate synthase
MPLDLIVEIGNAHDGSLGIATSMVDMAAKAGAKTVKFQMHLAEFESSKYEPFRKNFSLQDQNRFEYWKRVSFSFEHWRLLIDYTTHAGLEFLCSPFSLESAKWLYDDGRVKRWKIGSGEVTNYPLVDFMIETKLPILLSTGLITWNELLEIKSRFEAKQSWHKVTLLHCVSMYPAPLDKISLNVMDDLRSITENVGYSDHSGNISVPLLAYAMGANTIEIHMTPHKLFFGPDTQASLMPEEIRDLLKTSKDWDVMKNSGISRNALYDLSSETAKIFRKGIYWKRSLKSGHKVSIEDLVFLKPSSEIEAKDYEKVVGKVLNCDVQQGEVVRKLEVHQLHE